MKNIYEQYKKLIKSKSSKEKINPRQPLPTIETCMGSHSLKKRTELPIIATSMGSHSEKKPKVNENLEYDSPESNAVHEMHSMKLKNNSEEKEVKAYTDDSKSLNSALHEHAKGHDIPETHKNSANTLGGILDRHTLHHDMTLYTGVPKSPADLFKDNTDTPVVAHLPAFTSTSTRKVIANGFAKTTSSAFDEDHGISPDSKHVLVIHAPKGTKAASVKSHSWADSEDEFILHRGHNIRIHPNPIVDYCDRHGPVHHWHAEIVDHKPISLD